MIYTVTLNPAIDYIVRLDGALQPGTINRSAADAVEFGGKGINVSRVLQNLGHESVVLGFAAGFTGEALERGLAELGIHTRLIHVKQGMTRINVKVKADQETEINGTGPIIGAEELESLYRQLDGLRDGDTLVLSGSIPGCLPVNTYGEILKRLAGREIRTIVDTAGDALKCTLRHRPFLVKPNRQELAAFFHTSLRHDPEIIACARSLQNLGARNVLVSLAEDGALLVTEDGAVHRLCCPQGQIVNSVGAGDSMVAGFLAGWLETGDACNALKLGIAAGSATAFSLGLAEKPRIDQLLDRILQQEVAKL